MTLSCAAGVGASPALGAGAPTPTPRSTERSGGIVAATAPSGPVADASGTPRVPAVVPDPPARVRATVTRFAISPSRWKSGTVAPRFTIRIDADNRTAARVEVRVEDRKTKRVVLRQSLGLVRSGVDVSGRLSKRLASLPGSYRLRLVVRDQIGQRTAARARLLQVAPVDRPKAAPAPKPAPTPKPAPAPAPKPAPAPAPSAAGYVFPVQGACNFRTVAGQRFRAGRGGGRAHNGHDIGTFAGFPPVVAVTAGTISRVWFDVGGGGWTMVLDGDDGTAYGYLHLKPGSIQVAPGARVGAGQPIANAGQSGGDYEPHLHLEMRPRPWDLHRADAIDPFPFLSRLPNACTG